MLDGMSGALAAVFSEPQAFRRWQAGENVFGYVRPGTAERRAKSWKVKWRSSASPPSSEWL